MRFHLASPPSSRRLKRVAAPTRHCLTALAVFLAMQGAALAQTPADPFQPLSRALVVQATVYGYPLLGMYKRLTEEVIAPQSRKAGFNQYTHMSALSTPTKAPFPAPNNDTLYSTAWLDLRTEPAILSMPDTHGRYYTAHIMDMQTETIANLGQRLHGTQAGDFAVVGPGFDGPLPQGIKAVIRSPTPFALVLLRLLIDGPEDLGNATALQRKFLIRASTVFSGSAQRADAPLPAPYAATNSLERLAMLDRLLRMWVPPAQDSGLVSQFAAIGVGPGQSSLRLSLTSEAAEQSEKEALKAISAVGPRTGTFVNGWRVVRSGIGVYGTDYLQRASVWDGGPLANVPEESFYPAALLDNTGQMLDGGKATYTLRFAADQLPPASAFWSVTMYRMDDKMLVANPIDRYSIGNRTPSLTRDPDGSLTISIQAEPPESRQANWLPAPKAPFYLVLRLYGPSKAALAGEWSPPPLIRN